MKYLLGFLTGTIFGAAVALLYAPMSGDELRSEIRQEADARYQQASQQVQKSLTEVNQRLDRMTNEFKEMVEERRQSLPSKGEEQAPAE
ncbi:MAG: YtxH domain-containing protein [Anaerolineales bacterium]|jgi:gas vesicle protein